MGHKAGLVALLLAFAVNLLASAENPAPASAPSQDMSLKAKTPFDEDLDLLRSILKIKTTAAPTTTLAPPSTCPSCPTCTLPPPISTGAPPTSTGAPPTSTGAPSSSTGAPSSSTGAPPTTTGAPPTSTGAPPTSTGAPPTSTATPVKPVVTFNPNFPISATTGPGVWYPDRYVPSGFYGATTVAPPFIQGDVLQVYISSADAVTTRPAAFASTFYSTQGRAYQTNPTVTPGTALTFYTSIQLWVPASWQTTSTTSASLNRRAEIWGEIDSPTPGTQYFFPIIGFTNEYPNRDTTITPNYLTAGGAGRFHIFNPNPGPAFIDLTEPVRYDAYNELATQYTIDATGDLQVSFYVNGVLDTANIFDFGQLTTPSFPEILIEAYNYAQTDASSNVNQNDFNYNVFWRDVMINYGTYPVGGLAAQGLAAVNTTAVKPIRIKP